MDGLAITGYQYSLSTSSDNVTYSSFGSYQTASWSSGNTFTITNLTNGTYYKIKIRAVNALGGGADSAVIGPFKPNTVPSAPAAATVTLGTGATTTDTFTWTAPASNGSTITQYGWQTTTDGGSTWSTETVKTDLSSLTVAIQTAYTTSSSL